MPLQQVGRYRVVGRRRYRGHQPGSEFEVRLDPRAEARAIRRGDIAVLERIVPSVQPGSYRIPKGEV